MQRILKAARRPSVVAVVVIAAVTAGTAATAWRIHDTGEERLAERQLAQGRIVLEATIGGLEQPLATSASVGDLPGGTQDFNALMTPYIGVGGPFVGATLWSRQDLVEPASAVGGPLDVANVDPQIRTAFLEDAFVADGMRVLSLLDREPPRLGFASRGLDPTGGFLAYAELVLPEDRTSVELDDPAYDNVEFALFLGDAADSDQLIFASAAGIGDRDHYEETFTFGDQEVTLAFEPTGPLGGWMSANSWWLIVVLGLVIAALAAVMLERLVRARDRANRLADDNARLYQEQYATAVTLQRSLLPERLDPPVGVEVAARYEPAARQSEVGGDWYDVMETGERELSVIVGDVSGHGVRAAAIMAKLRFAARAYAAEGHSPASTLRSLGSLLEIGRDGHFATVLCATLDLERCRLLVASAGHPGPIVRDHGGTRSVDVRTAPPIGVPCDTYPELTVNLTGAGELFAFTDGVFERRDEPLDCGIERLRAATATEAGPLDDVLARIVESVPPGDRPDDLAIVALRWGGGSIPGEGER